MLKKIFSLYLAFFLICSVLLLSSGLLRAAQAFPGVETWERSMRIRQLIADNVSYLPSCDRLIVEIPVRELGEPLVSLSKLHNARFRPARLLEPHYDFERPSSYAKVRRGLYEKLELLLKIMPEDLGIAYFDTIIPPNAYKKYFDQKVLSIVLANNARNYKKISYEDVKKAYGEARLYIDPFFHGLSGVATGGVIYMTLFDVKTSKLLDMGKFDSYFINNDQIQTFSANTSNIQRANRLKFLGFTVKVGLVNDGGNCFKFSYGDKLWAYVKRKPAAIYGNIWKAGRNIEGAGDLSNDESGEANYGQVNNNAAECEAYLRNMVEKCNLIQKILYNNDR